MKTTPLSRSEKRGEGSGMVKGNVVVCSIWSSVLGVTKYINAATLSIQTIEVLIV